MSGNSLPDEIISEILSPALKVTDGIFSDTSDVSPFAEYSESTSAYLLVCKSWLRVATPLLYNVVILRSKAQAKALSIALSKDKQLGPFMKKLRVEGGYGPPMRVILECSPNISDLWLSLEIYSSDNSIGLCKGLTLINPTRLILRDCLYKRLDNKMLSQLVDALVLSIAKWDRLCIFDCPYSGVGGPTSDPSRLIIRSLLQSKRLHTLSIPYPNCLDWAYQAFKPCPLQAIHIKGPVWPWELSHIPADNPTLMALVKFREATAPGEAKVLEPIELPQIAPSLDPSFTPLAGAPEAVLDRILYFAMFLSDPVQNPVHSDISPRLPLLLVSKAFHARSFNKKMFHTILIASSQRIGLPHYYAHTSLNIPSSVLDLASVISSNRSIGSHIRIIAGRYLNSLGKDSGDAENPSMLAILSQTIGLVRMGHHKNFPGGPSPIDWTSYRRQTGISWPAFAALARSSGSTLRELFVRIGTSQQASTIIFSDLTALRCLDLQCESDFGDMANIPADGFPSLEVLRVSLASQSFLTALSLMKLESLRHVVFCYVAPAAETFLEAHGPKLTELQLPYSLLQTLKVGILELCPNLSTISLPMRVLLVRPATFDPRAVSNPSLARFFPCPRTISAALERFHHVIATWERFFTTFDPTSFPNLREMEVECCVWPTSERDIAKSCWVRWAEILLKHNVSLTDKTGKKWRPRLQVK
ncbi:hypothetical protein C8R47DRAFT_996509 [Mycena vitilis]|nr:hypothetical protein C8R47DRAFT_996509 [Mycena vitilis]